MTVPSVGGSQGAMVGDQSGSTIVVAFPASVTAGQIAFLWLGMNNARSVSSESTGEFAAVGLDQSSSNYSSALWWKRCDGDEGGTSVTVTVNTSYSATNAGGGRIYMFGNGSDIIGTGTPFEDATGAGSPTSAEIVPTATIDTTGADRRIVTFVGFDNDTDTPPTPPSPWSRVGTLGIWNFTGDGTLDCVTREAATAQQYTAVDIGSYGPPGAAFYRSITLALIPAGGTTVEGSVSASFGGTFSAAGVPTTQGAATASFGFTATAIGNPRVVGQAVAEFGGTFEASGVAGAPPVTGQVSAEFGFSATASGVDRALGSVVASFGFSAAASGVRRTHGVAVVSFGFTVTATGTTWDIPATVQASAETEVPGGASGDVADDPYIWRNRSDPEASFILCSNKSAGADGGVYTHNLDGTLASVTHWLIGEVNSVDGRDLAYDEYSNVDVDWAGRVLVVASNRTDGDLTYGFMNRSTGEISDAGATSLAFEPYGLALYVSPSTGAVHVFVSEATGGSDAVRQYELTVSGGTVSGSQVRNLDSSIGSLTEGMVCWEPEEWLFLAEEDTGVYRYDAEPDGGTSRTTVDLVSGPNLAADVEGMAIAAPADGQPGFLVVSSQGDSEFAVYELDDPHSHVANFSVVANGGIDAVSDTDGLDLVREPFGDVWPEGLFVVHDATNTGGSASNFKLVDAGEIFGPLPAATVEGSASASFGGTFSAAGVPTTQGAATASFGFTATANGVDRALGAVVASFGFSATASGVRRTHGVAVASFGFTATASGVAGTPPVQGQVSASFGFSAAASGVARSLGQTVASFGFTATAGGAPRKQGAATASFGFTATAIGNPRVVGQVVASFGFTAAIVIITYRLAVVAAAGPRQTATAAGPRHTAVAGRSRFITED